MPVLHLMCGLPCSGKTTLARTLERDLGALRLCPDEWMAHIVGDGRDEAKRASVEAMQWEVAARVLTLGLDVILENGFWSRTERDDYRRRAKEAGAETKVHFLDVKQAELQRRLKLRNAALPSDTFHVTPAELDLWCTWFESPTTEELA